MSFIGRPYEYGLPHVPIGQVYSPEPQRLGATYGHAPLIGEAVWRHLYSFAPMNNIRPRTEYMETKIK